MTYLPLLNTIQNIWPSCILSLAPFFQRSVKPSFRGTKNQKVQHEDIHPGGRSFNDRQAPHLAVLGGVTQCHSWAKLCGKRRLFFETKNAGIATTQQKLGHVWIVTFYFFFLNCIIYIYIFVCGDGTRQKLPALLALLVMSAVLRELIITFCLVVYN